MKIITRFVQLCFYINMIIVFLLTFVYSLQSHKLRLSAKHLLKTTFICLSYNIHLWQVKLVSMAQCLMGTWRQHGPNGPGPYSI